MRLMLVTQDLSIPHLQMCVSSLCVHACVCVSTFKHRNIAKISITF